MLDLHVPGVRIAADGKSVVPVNSGGRRNNSSIRGGALWRMGDFERLTPEAIDQVWVRLKAGQATKPTARELVIVHQHGPGVPDACGGIMPTPRRRVPCWLSLVEREETSRWARGGVLDRSIATALGRAPSTLSQEIARIGGRRRYRWARRTGEPEIGRLVRSRPSWLGTGCCVES